MIFSKIEQNKKYSVIYYISVVSLIIIVCCNFIIISPYVYASSDNNITEPLDITGSNEWITVASNGSYTYSVNVNNSYSGNICCLITYVGSYGGQSYYAPVYFFDSVLDHAPSGFSVSRNGNYSPQKVDILSSDSYTAFDGYAVANQNFTSTNCPIYYDYTEALTVVDTFFNNSPSSSGNAVVLSTDAKNIGVNKLNQSVYLTAAYLNDSAYAFYEESGVGYVPMVISKNDYGVFKTINGTDSALLSTSITYDGVTWYQKYDTSSSFVFDTVPEEVGYFSSESDAIEACIDAINTVFPSDGRQNILYYLPGGNIAYTQISEYSSDILLNITSNYTGNASSLNALNVLYGWVSSAPEALPADINSLISSLTPVSWTLTGSTNILGQHNTGQAVISSSGHSDEWFILYNPLESNFQSNNYIYDGNYSSNMNPDVLINVTNISDQRIFGITSLYSPSTGQYNVTPSGTLYNRDMTSVGNVFTDSSGNAASPIQGGGGNSNSVTNFWTWLNGKFEELKNLFATGHDTIQTLVGYGTDFMVSVQNLYAWLPSPVYSVLCSSLILVIIIGVVKVFI